MAVILGVLQRRRGDGKKGDKQKLTFVELRCRRDGDIIISVSAVGHGAKTLTKYVPLSGG